MLLEQAVKELGFKDEAEFHRLVASVDISTEVKLLIFKKWQKEDGTKKRLLETIDKCKIT